VEEALILFPHFQRAVTYFSPGPAVPTPKGRHSTLQM
jgi:hypothetical protein